MNGIFVQSLNKDTHSNSLSAGEGILAKKPRNSNLELYRIICMLMIVAHHYVVNSGLWTVDGPIMTNPKAYNSLFLLFLGAWGKTGINCFLMITGYFMCTSKITLRKFVKLMGQIYLYRWVIFIIFFVTGYESLSPLRLLKLIMPVWNFTDGFISCFIGFWLTIPFLNIMIHNMNKRQHELLLILMLLLYTLLGSVPSFNVTFNYVVWFGIIYFIASYIRMYPNPLFDSKKLWGYMTLISVLLASLSIFRFGYHFVSDSNKLFAVVVAVCSFLWFKNMNIKYSKVINAFGASTFGVLLIHANSSAMRTWLWKNTVDSVGHYSLPFGYLVLYCVGVVVLIFVICNLLDQLRIASIEKCLLSWYDRKMAIKAESWVNKLVRNN